METTSINCPQCGAPIEIKNRYSKIIVCEYCDTHSSVETGNAEIMGKFPKLADLPTWFFLGATGTINGERFEIIGRMRYQHASGFWDEWFASFENNVPAWITEDEGEFSLMRGKKIKSAPPEYDAVSVGQKIELNNMQISVLEKGEASVAGAQGQLNFYIQPGATMRYIEGVADGKLISIEISENEIELFIGDELERSDIIIENRQ